MILTLGDYELHGANAMSNLRSTYNEFVWTEFTMKARAENFKIRSNNSACGYQETPHCSTNWLSYTGLFKKKYILS
jgi:hypothetical protein